MLISVYGMCFREIRWPVRCVGRLYFASAKESGSLNLDSGDGLRNVFERLRLLTF